MVANPESGQDGLLWSDLRALDYCEAKQILVEAYSPTAHGRVVEQYVTDVSPTGQASPDRSPGLVDHAAVWAVITPNPAMYSLIGR